jgi:hypothetical protein
MSTLFAINFRREAYQRAIARVRRRVFALGVWVAYFGVLAIVAGLYGLNAVALSHQLRQIERQTARARQIQGAAGSWKVGDAELVQIEAFVQNPRQWHDRLVRLAAVLPPNVRLGSITVNPQNVSGTADQNKLVITGQLRPAAGQDRMQGVMRIVSTIHEDSVFKRSYQNVKLASTRIVEDGDGAAEFVIECR